MLNKKSKKEGAKMFKTILYLILVWLAFLLLSYVVFTIGAI